MAATGGKTVSQSFLMLTTVQPSARLFQCLLGAGGVCELAIAGCAVLVVAVAGLVVLRFDARHVFDGLFGGWGLVFALTALIAIVGTVWLVGRGAHRGTRLTAIAAAASLVLACGMAQRPYLLPTTLTIDAGAGDPDSLRWLATVTVVAVLLVGPALALLYRMDLTDRLRADHDADLVEDLIRTG